MSYPQYPGQAPQYPQAPQGAPYYPPPQQPSYPPNAQYSPVPPHPPVQHTIDDFYGQPSISGKSISFNGKQPGTNYTGVVTRNLTRGDVIVQTDPATNQTAMWRDGREKLTLVIPLQMQPSPEFPDGRASWYCKANERAELDHAMEEAGLPHGSVPEQGGILSITFTREVPTRPGLNPRKEKHITYTPPAAPASQPAIAPVQEPAAQGVQAAIPPQPAATPPQTASMVQPPSDLTPEQQELLARLRGQ